MKKEFKITLDDQVIHADIPDQKTAEHLFWGRVRHDGSRGSKVVLYQNDRILYQQVARYR